MKKTLSYLLPFSAVLCTLLFFSCGSEDSKFEEISSSSTIEAIEPGSSSSELSSSSIALSSSSSNLNSSSSRLSSSSIALSSSNGASQSSSSGTAIIDPPGCDSPVSCYGELKASGNKLVGSKTGTTAVQVRGVSLGWSNKNWESARFFTATTVNAMVDEWKAEIIRVPIGYAESGGYKTDPGNLTRVKTAIDAALEKDVYVVIDWHSHDAHNELDAATAFFEEMAQTYGSKDNVIFEIYNEPVPNKSGTWANIKTYANSIIPVIRKHSDNLILVGTPSWDQQVNAGLSDPISDGNIAYVFHFYAQAHKRSAFQSRLDAVLEANYPVFVSEYGTTHNDGGNPNENHYDTHSTANTDEWYEYMDSKKISSCAWNVNDKYEGSAFFGVSTAKFDMTSWTDKSKMTASGQYIYDKLRAYANSAAWRSGGF